MKYFKVDKSYINLDCGRLLERPLSCLLLFGIGICPIIFSLFTFRNGYTMLTKLLSIIWLIILVLTFINPVFNTLTDVVNIEKMQYMYKELSNYYYH